MKLFGKVLGWLFLGGIIVFVVLIVVSLLLFDMAMNTPVCDSADEVIEMMEAFVEYDFDSDDYEVEEWYYWGHPDLNKSVTLLVKNKKVWNDFVEHFEPKDASFIETYGKGVKTTTIEIDKDNYRKECEWRNDDTYEWTRETFVLNYEDKTIKYYYFEE